MSSTPSRCLAPLLWFALLAFAPFARADNSAAEKVLNLLYPQSISWVSLDSLPRAPTSFLDYPPEIEMLGRAAALRDQPDRCSPMLRMFAGNHAIDHLRQGNLFGTGDHDLIYDGLNPCAEGSWAVIWPSGLSLGKKPDAIVLRGELWRVLPGTKLKAAGVLPGCCGDPWSQYCLYDPVPYMSCTAAATDLALPDGAKAERKLVVISRGVELQVEPNSDDSHSEYDPYQPPHIAAGTRGKQLLLVADDAGRIWRLVQVQDHLHRRAAGPTYLLGWVGD